MSDAPPVLAQSVEMVALDDLTEWPNNPREGDVGALVESITANGFGSPLLVQKSSSRVVAGNHRLQAARALGMERVPVCFIDVDDERALRLLLAENRLSDRASYDDRALSELLMDLAQQTERGLDGSGYSRDDLDALLADVNTPPDFDHGESDGDSEPFTCPACGWSKA